MIALITALLGALPNILGAVTLFHPPTIPPLPDVPPQPATLPSLPSGDLITVVDANAIDKANLDSGQAVTLATYPEGSDIYTVVVFKNGGPAASALGL